MRLVVAVIIGLLVPATAMAGECADDKEKFCKDVIAAKGKVGACLKQHKAELSESCKAKLDGKTKDQPKPGNGPSDNATKP
jgi:hypothetical protein